MKRWLLSLFLFVGFTSFAYSEYIDSRLDEEVVSFQEERNLPIFQEEIGDIEGRESTSTLGLLFELFFLLIFLSALLYVFILFIRKLGKPKSSSGLPSDLSSFRVLEEQSLSEGKLIRVLEVYSQIIVIAETSNSINFLYEIKDKDIKDKILLDYSKSKSLKMEHKKKSFFSELQGKIKNITTKDTNSSSMGDSGNEGSQSMEHFKESKERLKNL